MNTLKKLSTKLSTYLRSFHYKNLPPEWIDRKHWVFDKSQGRKIYLVVPTVFNLVKASE